MPKIKGILIPAGGFDYYEVEVERDNILDYCYEHLNCRCIDIVTGSFDKDGQFDVNIIVDDEGLLKDTPIVNPIAWYLYSKFDKEHPIVGDALLFDSNNSGDLTSATDLMVSGTELLSNKLPFLYMVI